MSVPSVLQKLEKCPHGCGATITHARKGGVVTAGKIKVVYHCCKSCGKTYSVRYAV